MSTVKNLDRALALGVLMVGTLGAGPVLAATEVPLGRENPFKPLILDQPQPAEDQPVIPPAPLPPDAVRPPALPPPVATPEPLAYVAFAQDGDAGGGGALAGVRVGGVTRFVQVGDRIGADEVVAISRDTLTLRSGSRTVRLSRKRS